MTAPVKFIDLDAIVPDEVVVKLGGIEHKLVPLSVEDFINNTKDVEKYASEVISTEAEIEMVSKMLMRAFPTMTVEMLRKLTLPQLQTLVQFAQDHNGQRQVEKDNEAENPQKAG